MGVSLRGGSERTAGLYTWQEVYARILVYESCQRAEANRVRGQLALFVHFHARIFLLTALLI